MGFVARGRCRVVSLVRFGGIRRRGSSAELLLLFDALLELLLIRRRDDAETSGDRDLLYGHLEESLDGRERRGRE